MQIYLFRHGLAEDTQPGSSDAARRLTDEGRRKTASVVRLARKAGLNAPLVISSPYVRAVETARIVMKELEVRRDLIETVSLVPYGTPHAVWNEVREYRDERVVLLAGHEPLMSQLVAFLLNTPTLRVEMKKSAMVRIDVESFRPVPEGMLRWMVTPALAESV